MIGVDHNDGLQCEVSAMTVRPVISLITLGVTDLERSTAFYQALGWPLSSSSEPGTVSFFRTAGGLLGLYGSDDLADDIGLPRIVLGPGYRGVTLAINLGSPAEVDAAIAEAAAAGGTVLKPAHATDWGGYSGYFADPDGHAIEVAHNPFWPLGPDGVPQLPH
jgi:catechol 2,3-dioxygenase-like lactoylglutathione lyase family enzyme